MGVYYKPVDEELLRIAQEVIDAWHPELKRARIGFVFKSEAGTHKGHMVLADVGAIPARMKIHLELDYIVSVAFDVWNRFDDKKRRALLDHEFCHCYRNSNTGEWTTRDHDVQEFVEVVQRHGLWTNSLTEMDQAIRQAPLPGLTDKQQGFVRSVTLTAATMAEVAHAASGS